MPARHSCRLGDLLHPEPADAAPADRGLSAAVRMRSSVALNVRAATFAASCPPACRTCSSVTVIATHIRHFVSVLCRHRGGQTASGPASSLVGGLQGEDLGAGGPAAGGGRQ